MPAAKFVFVFRLVPVILKLELSASLVPFPATKAYVTAFKSVDDKLAIVLLVPVSASVTLVWLSAIAVGATVSNE